MIDSARPIVLLATGVKKLKAILACITLVAFGGSYAVAEAHGASVCSDESLIAAHHCAETAEIAPADSADDQHSGKTQPGCHCPNSANCSFLIGGAISASHSIVLTETLSSDDQIPTDSARDGPARPPRA